MSEDEIIAGWNGETNPEAPLPENPAGDIDLTEDDLESVAGGTLDCTGSDTYCKGTCGIPWLTYGCCVTGY